MIYGTFSALSSCCAPEIESELSKLTDGTEGASLFRCPRGLGLGLASIPSSSGAVLALIDVDYVQRQRPEFSSGMLPA